MRCLLSFSSEYAIDRLHQEVDVEARRLEGLHHARMQCRRGCHGCCVDDLSVFDVEAERIRRTYPHVLGDEAPHPVGACAMLGPDGGCRIYAARPQVCRTQGLPLRWFAEGPDGGIVEHRDICPLNDPGPPIEGLDAEECWLIGPTEGGLAALQQGTGDGLRRVALRALFRP